ncbi:hypothetical protein D477_002054 [Arthrobacter crystallopoietes BAB-32]|uniref:Probable membrane transporter protein n=1 Tax=Arthrobacter crystallopoietes BAB-32 TaxID=1246476 RepID=N1UZW3_9MICC|nr:sulfite exporter TauE/SafE family protein [Arthrobacter crystallopoietes]EMY35946.1 hypothetical protein D477_002054 [Arthrobacter crystallopoietes BAB-32]
MDLVQSAIIALAGLWAGTINSIVGSGTLVTFPVLVALGIAPVTATISNAMGLIAGNVGGVFGYRRELRGLSGTLKVLLPASLLGGITGAALLLRLPEEVFAVAAPFLIVVALLFVVFQPRLQAWVRERQAAQARTQSRPWVLLFLVYFAGVYGGYFVAAQGVLLVGILGVFLHGSLQQANAVKNVLVLGVNIIAAISYMVFAFDRINWWVVLVIAVSSLAGSLVGAAVGRRLKPVVLRGIIVVLGLVALFVMVSNLAA